MCIYIYILFVIINYTLTNAKHMRDYIGTENPDHYVHNSRPSNFDEC